MRTYLVTLEFSGLRDGTHYYADQRVRAGSADRAELIAQQRYGGLAIASSEVRG